MGMGPTDAVKYVGVRLSAPYTKAFRDPAFKLQLDQAMEAGRRSIIISPRYWAYTSGAPIVDANFEPIPREPTSALLPWVLLQLERSPLAALVG